MLRNKIIQLLDIENRHGMEAIFYAAKKEKIEVFGNKIFICGLIRISTWCKNNCKFCYYRKSNKIMRCRKELEEIIAIAKQFADSGINFINLSMGEDLKYHDEDFKSVLRIIDQIKSSTGLPVMISPGVMRVNQDYDARMDAKNYAREQGILIEEGILTGVGESIEDIADSILMMGEIGAKQMSTRSFVKQKGASMKKVIKSNRDLELKIIAIMRLLYPEALISALLDVNGTIGLRDSVNAGANVVTAIIPSEFGFEGVAQSHVEIENPGYSIEDVRIILKELGLEVDSVDEYKKYLETMHNPYDK